jgi:hypothetical protein
MVIYDRFVFLHLPKTAGIFVTEVLRDELGPPAEVLETHAGWDSIPSGARDRPVLMFVRNPWDWYVSWYHFWTGPWLRRQPPAEVRRDPWVRLLFGDRVEVVDGDLRGVPDFAATVRTACRDLVPGNPALADLIAAGDPHAAAIAPGDDFYSARFKQMAGAGLGTDQLTIGRFEALAEDLGRFLAEHSPVADDDGGARRIAARGSVNATDRRPYREYYDDELRALVGDSCRTLIEGFDYRF